MPAKQTKVIKPQGGTRGHVEPRPERPIDVTASYAYEEAAAHLQISVRTLKRLKESGRIGFMEVNQRQVRFLGRHILDFEERQSRRARR